MPALAEAMRGRKRDPAEELSAIVGDIYDALARNRVGIKLVDRSAGDIPDLGQLWFGGARSFLVDALAHYVADRARSGHLRAPTDVGVAARFIVENCAFWAVHRHWDVGRPEIPEERIRAAVIDLVKGSLIHPAKSNDTPKEKGRKR